MKWEDAVNDPEEVKVFMALNAPGDTWRTVSGIAWQTGLAERRLAEILKKYNLTLTRTAETPSLSALHWWA